MFGMSLSQVGTSFPKLGQGVSKVERGVPGFGRSVSMLGKSLPELGRHHPNVERPPSKGRVLSYVAPVGRSRLSVESADAYHSSWQGQDLWVTSDDGRLLHPAGGNSECVSV